MIIQTIGKVLQIVLYKFTEAGLQRRYHAIFLAEVDILWREAQNMRGKLVCVDYLYDCVTY